MKVYPRIADYLRGLPDICTVHDDMFQFKFTGMVILNDVPVLVLPKNYAIPENIDEKYKHAGVFEKVLMRYRNEPYHEQEENKLLYGMGSDNARIAVAFQIIEDYLAYGILEGKKSCSLNHQKVEQIGIRQLIILPL
ncbi:hypothetical protein [Alkaliphilus hydrothermalis]|uniref:Uncharacterized protein n=1 Tax=Alkaliphilus hydrothermalis TaxID=1482730 RepID=A0ABS2NRR6_9FIRM|nr:hypothetical protein [Alkaliphilus hydrothermalis]MBM7615611.1 hypothetical protein [Alkaliphilus hydrothermalis]